MTDQQGPGSWPRDSAPGSWDPTRGYPPPPGGAHQWGSPPPPPMRSNSKAIWALVLGIVAATMCLALTGVPAIILGMQSKREIDGSGGREGGRGLATAGIVLGWLGVAVTVLLLIPVLAIIIVAAAAN